MGVCSDRSPCLICWSISHSKSVLGGPSGGSGVGGTGAGGVVVFLGGVGGLGGFGGTGVVLFCITLPVLFKTKESFVAGCAMSQGLMSVETCHSKSDFRGSAGGVGGGGGGGGVDGGLGGGVGGGGVGLGGGVGGGGGAGVVLF